MNVSINRVFLLVRCLLSDDVTAPTVVIPHEQVAHGEADYVVCMGCFRDVKIEWGDTQSTGFAFCECDRRYGYKYKYEKLVRV